MLDNSFCDWHFQRTLTEPSCAAQEEVLFSKHREFHFLGFFQHTIANSTLSLLMLLKILRNFHGAIFEIVFFFPFSNMQSNQHILQNVYDLSRFGNIVQQIFPAINFLDFNQSGCSYQGAIAQFVLKIKSCKLHSLSWMHSFHCHMYLTRPETPYLNPDSFKWSSRNRTFAKGN